MCLALAEALAKTGDAHGAQDAYRHARDLIQALPPSRNRDDWLHEADLGLSKRSVPHYRAAKWLPEKSRLAGLEESRLCTYPPSLLMQLEKP